MFPKHRIVATDKLVAYDRNPRTHSDAQVDKLVASIREFGFTNAILTDGKRGVVAGHGRLMAALKLGLPEVPTLELSHLTAVQRRAYVIADNKLALDAGWDENLLVLELGDLADEGYDLGLTGFDKPELDSLFGEADEASGAGNLAELFGISPFTVLNAREGWWQDRKRAWLALGIQSELGRGGEQAGIVPGGQGLNMTATMAGSGRKANAVPGGGPMPLDRAKNARRANATPGGAAMPATDYRKSHARGDGRGRAVA